MGQDPPVTLAVVLIAISLALVGRTGADADALVVIQLPVDSLDAELEPEEFGHMPPKVHTRSMGQQPPPRFIGQAL